MTAAVMRRLGMLSYSVYMLHMPIVDYGFYSLRTARIPVVFGWNWRTGLVLAGLWGICFALAACTYHVIEYPFLVRKARVAG